MPSGSRKYRQLAGGAGWLGLLVLACGGCQVAATGQNAAGVRMFQSGQYEAAMQQFQQAVASDPRNADAYYNMAATLHRTGASRNDQKMLEQAEALYNQCLDYNENHPECYRGLAVLLVETGRSDRAFSLMRNWVTRTPESADARIELARLYQEFGDSAAATRQLEQALQIDQQNSRAWAALAHLREQSGDLHQAMANYQRSLTINQFQPDVAQRVASLSGVLGNSASAAGDTTRTVQHDWTPRY